MKKKIKENQMYVLRKSRQTIKSIVLVDEPLPLTEERHKSLDLLSKKTDVILVFPKTTEVKGLDKIAFGRLYDTLGLIEAPVDGVVSTTIKVIEYIIEVIEQTSTISFSNISTVHEETTIKKLGDLDYATIKPVFEIERLGVNELSKIYIRDDVDNREPEKPTIIEFINKVKDLVLNFINRTNVVSPENVIDWDTPGSYRLYDSKSGIIVFRVDTLKHLLSSILSDHYVRTFRKDSSISALLASSTMAAGISNINSSIESLDFNNLRGK